MSRSHKPIRALIPLLGAGLLVGGSAADPSFAADGTTSTVLISNLASGQTVSGTVEVDVAVHQDPAAPVTAVGLTLPSVSLATLASQPVHQVQPVPATCTDACTLVFTVDTAQTAPLAGTDIQVPLIADRATNIIVAGALGKPVPGPTATTQVTVDNHRPSTTLPDMPQNAPLGVAADTGLALRADAAPATDAPAGSTVTSLRLAVPGHPEWPAIAFVPTGDGGWSATVDTSAIPAGAYTAAAVATDSNGMTGDYARATLVIDHGFNVTFPTDGYSAPTDVLTSDLQYGYGTSPLGCGSDAAYAAPQKVDVYLDGRLFHSANATTLVGQGPHCAVAIAGTDTHPPALPFGTHQLRFVVTDTRGHTGQTSVTMTVDLPLMLSLSPAETGGKVTVALGSITRITPRSTAPDGFSKPTDWWIQASGVTSSYTEGTGATVPVYSFHAGATGTERITYTVQDAPGLQTSTTVNVLVLATTSSSLQLSTTKPKRGSTLTLTAHVTKSVSLTKNPASLKGATVHLQFQATGSKTWTTKATATTTAAGNATFREKATANGIWRIVTAARTGSWEGSTSSSHSVKMTK
ncbi:hypothetical protein ACEZDB_18540 [Streptacidiphilus sp. N1-3]|uniref:Ig-like domain (Group 3) n=1 Tax=Streptacidiphilus alkalitolerans TaxID=3342712 RepID=A0ABV6X370_9ACTN